MNRLTTMAVAAAGILLAAFGGGGHLGCAGQGTAQAATEPATLRALYGLEGVRSVETRSTALVLVDYQEEFFRGRLPVRDGNAALTHAAELLAWARDRNIFVVHVRNVAARENSPVFAASSPSVAIAPPLAPRPGETVITKSAAGGFTKTDLDALLRARGIETIVVGGIMTHLAVDSTVRDGALLGYRVLLAGDACATRDLPAPAGSGPGVVDAATVHRATLAALADRFAEVLPTSAIVALPVTAPHAR